MDFTGKNPNVYYEAGLADAWKKDWIVFAQSADDLTFDVRHIRRIQYSNTMGSDEKLEADPDSALRSLHYKACLSSGNSVAAVSHGIERGGVRTLEQSWESLSCRRLAGS